ncbi:hypothetical protein PLESTF_001236400 [Pleodorina starrii]|nr:hypothetical protein PLESTM_000379200 [Pleodorina starrii]GLC72333.1 hypothetical protein PLESTF_001236400 [Pleodorina starrii]
MLVRTQRHGKGRVLIRGAAAEPPEPPSTCRGGGAAGGIGISALAGDNVPSAGSSGDGHARGDGCRTLSGDGEADVSGSSPAPPSTQLVVHRGSKPPLPAPRWPPALRTSSLPYCRPACTEGLMEARAALYGSRAIRLAAVLDRPRQLSEALIRHARTTRGSPRVTAAWRSRADVHRFLCHSEQKQALEAVVQGPYRLRCPDTSPLVLPSVGHSRDAGLCTTAAAAFAAGVGAGVSAAGVSLDGGRNGGGGGVVGGNAGDSDGGGRQPTLAESLRCLEEWRQHKALIQMDLCRLAIHHHHGDHYSSGSNRDGNDGSSSSSGSGGWSVDFETCDVETSRGDGGYGGDWLAVCKELLSPVLRWVRQELLGRYWGYGGGAGEGEDGAPRSAQGHLPLPYTGGVLSLEWGSDGALLPLRYHASDDRVLLQVCGRRRVLLVPPEYGLPSLAPFPVLHPYDGYSMPAVAHTLVYDTPGVDVERAAATVLSGWPGLDKVPGYVAVLDPGDGLLVPAGWFLHSELLPPPPPPPSQHQRQQPQPHHHASSTQSSHHNIGLVLTLTPLVRSTAAAVPATAASQPRERTPADTDVTDGNCSGRAAAAASATVRAPEAAAAAVVVAAAAAARPLRPGASLLQLCRLLESWALAVEVQPGPELRNMLEGLAEYHRARRRVERQLRQPGQPGQEEVQSGREEEEEEVEEQKGRSRAAVVEEGDDGTQQQQQQQTLQKQQGEGEVREGHQHHHHQHPHHQQQRDQRLQQWLQLRLHPTFNGFTPRGRVLMDLYDAVVRHVAPVAHSVLAATAAVVVAATGVADTDAVRSANRRPTSGRGGAGNGAHCLATGNSNGDKDDDDDKEEEEEEDDDGVAALLKLLCERRLSSTDWVNQLCRDPEVAREQLLWYDDRRTMDEARFPELFRLQLAAKDAAARQTSLRPAALPYQSLLAAPPEAPQRLPAPGADR